MVGEVPPDSQGMIEITDDGRREVAPDPACLKGTVTRVEGQVWDDLDPDIRDEVRGVESVGSLEGRGKSGGKCSRRTACRAMVWFALDEGGVVRVYRTPSYSFDSNPCGSSE